MKRGLRIQELMKGGKQSLKSCLFAYLLVCQPVCPWRRDKRQLERKRNADGWYKVRRGKMGRLDDFFLFVFTFLVFNEYYFVSLVAERVVGGFDARFLGRRSFFFVVVTIGGVEVAFCAAILGGLLIMFPVQWVVWIAWMWGNFSFSKRKGLGILGGDLRLFKSVFLRVTRLIFTTFGFGVWARRNVRLL